MEEFISKKTDVVKEVKAKYAEEIGQFENAQFESAQRICQDLRKSMDEEITDTVKLLEEKKKIQISHLRASVN